MHGLDHSCWHAATRISMHLGGQVRKAMCRPSGAFFFPSALSMADRGEELWAVASTRDACTVHLADGDARANPLPKAV
jgi:hypothetical protein